jgi:hypothetical protein
MTTVPHQLVHVTQIEGLGEGATANFGTGHNDIARGDATQEVHQHVIERWNGASGQTDFDLSDFWEHVESVMEDGAEVDPLAYSLSGDGSQILFDTGLGADAVIVAHGHAAQV